MGAAVAEFFGALWARWKARRAAQAMSDLEKGKAILEQAQREADEMAAAAAAAEARKRLDTELSGVPVVGVPVGANAAPALVVAPSMPATLPPAKT